MTEKKKGGREVVYCSSDDFKPILQDVTFSGSFSNFLSTQLPDDLHRQF